MCKLFSNTSSLCRILLLILVTGIAGVMHIWLPNMGGTALKLPQNIIAWTLMALLVLIITLAGLRRRRSLVFTPSSIAFLSAIGLLAIPLLWTRPEWHEAALWRLGGLFGGWVFYFCWLQVRLPAIARATLLYILLFASTVQALLALLQLAGVGWVPYPTLNGRPYGVFQQVNVLASFIATGLGITLMTLLLPAFRLPDPAYERYRKRVLSALLIIFPALLVCLQSRIGWLGGAAVSLLSLLCFARYSARRTLTVLLLLVCGVALGVLALHWGAGARSAGYVGSDSARLAILQTGWAMLQEKPWLGWGVGGFEYNFQHYRLQQGLSTEGLGVVTHPHNELLFQGIEAGITGLLAMAVVLFAGLRLAVRAWRRAAAKPAKPEALGWCLVLVPIALHTQTEYPFELSAVIWLIFLLLLAQLDQRVSRVCALPLIPGKVARGGLALLALGCAGMMASGLQGNLALTQFERNGLRNIDPVATLPDRAFWGQQERLQFDLQTYALLRYNHTRSEALLADYVRWADDYLAHKVDVNVYASLIAILRHQGQQQQAAQRWQEATGLFPQDPRFAKAK